MEWCRQRMLLKCEHTHTRTHKHRHAHATLGKPAAHLSSCSHQGNGKNVQTSTPYHQTPSSLQQNRSNTKQTFTPWTRTQQKNSKDCWQKWLRFHVETVCLVWCHSADQTGNTPGAKTTSSTIASNLFSFLTSMWEQRDTLCMLATMPVCSQACGD